MGISTSVNVEVEEFTLLPPEVTLPLDITKFISRWKQGVPQSLLGFYVLSRQLHQQFNRLPVKDTKIPEDWVPQSTEWAQETLQILDDMHKVTQKLTKTRPADLYGNFHAVEEYTTDIASTIDEFVEILRPLQCAKTKNTALIRKALNDIRRIYMFQGYFLDK